jgi:hypothetical protein
MLRSTWKVPADEGRASHLFAGSSARAPCLGLVASFCPARVAPRDFSRA